MDAEKESALRELCDKYDFGHPDLPVAERLAQQTKTWGDSPIISEIDGLVHLAITQDLLYVSTGDFNPLGMQWYCVSLKSSKEYRQAMGVLFEANRDQKTGELENMMLACFNGNMYVGFPWGERDKLLSDYICLSKLTTLRQLGLLQVPQGSCPTPQTKLEAELDKLFISNSKLFWVDGLHEKTKEICTRGTEAIIRTTDEKMDTIISFRSDAELPLMRTSRILGVFDSNMNKIALSSAIATELYTRNMWPLLAHTHIISVNYNNDEFTVSLIYDQTEYAKHAIHRKMGSLTDRELTTYLAAFLSNTTNLYAFNDFIKQFVNLKPETSHVFFTAICTLLSSPEPF